MNINADLKNIIFGTLRQFKITKLDLKAKEGVFTHTRNNFVSTRSLPEKMKSSEKHRWIVNESTLTVRNKLKCF